MRQTLILVNLLGCAGRPDAPPGLEQPCDSGSRPCPGDLRCELNWSDVFRYNDEIFRCRAPCSTPEDCEFYSVVGPFVCHDDVCEHYLPE